jgi:hypothetical protein
MSKHTLEIDIPDGADVAHVLRSIYRSIEEEVSAATSTLAALDALESDTALTAYMAKRRLDGIAYVRASTYSSDKGCVISREFHAFNGLGGDPRRPVVMKGSRHYLIGKHSASNVRQANGYLEAVFLRWLRMSKFSGFPARLRCGSFPPEPSPYEKRVRQLHAHSDKRGLGASYHLDRNLHFHEPKDTSHRFPGEGEHLCWIRGKETYLTRAQISFSRAMHNVIKKTKSLDKRMAALRKYRQAQLVLAEI